MREAPLLLLLSACASGPLPQVDAPLYDRPADKDGPVVELWAISAGAPRPILMDQATRLRFGSRTELVGKVRHPAGLRVAVLHAQVTLHCAPPTLPAALSTHVFEVTIDEGPAADGERELRWELDMSAYSEACDQRALEIADLSGTVRVVAVGDDDKLGKSPSLEFWAK